MRILIGDPQLLLPASTGVVVAQLRTLAGLIACVLLVAGTVDCPGVVTGASVSNSQDTSGLAARPAIGARPGIGVRPPPSLPVKQVDYGLIINQQIESCGPVHYDPSTYGFAGYGCQIQIPAGVFVIDTPLRMKSGITLSGQGRAATILRLGNNVNKSVIQIGTNDSETGPFSWVDFLSYINIEHLSIDGNATKQSQPGYGIHIATSGYITVRDVRIANVNSHAIVVDSGPLVGPEGAGLRVGSVRLEDIDIFAAPQPGFMPDSYGTMPVGIYLFGSADSWISKVQINGTSAMYADLYIRDCGSMNIGDNTFSGGGQTTSVAVGGVNDHIRIHDNYFDPAAGRLNPNWTPITYIAPTSCTSCDISK